MIHEHPHAHPHAHEEKHFTGSAVVRDLVIGMSDGLTVPFALTAGLSGAVHDNAIVITAGIAEIIAGSIAMGLGGYLAGKTEYDHYLSEEKREYDEVEHLPEKEKAEIEEILSEYGISEKVKKEFVDELAKDKDKWVEFMMKFELGLEKPELNRARNSALTIAAAYVGGGFIPMASYFFTETPEHGLYYSVGVTVIALALFGFFKNRAIGQNPWKGALKVTIIGIIAAGSAFAIAKLVSGH
ncbi:MAG: VIT1/CCC1 transporter family protein [Bacteroidetes bacterium]|nr:VIT1/CCC1 transporter family protein [Bacteroidota bacterium]